MAIRGSAARRYADAVFSMGRDTNTLDRWLQDLRTLNEAFSRSNVVAALEDPKLTEGAQRELVGQLLGSVKLDPLTQNFLYLLVRRRRLRLLPRIAEVFQELYNKEKGIVVADVTTALPLDAEQQKRVGQQLSRITGKTVQLRVHQDPKILGGIVTRIGDELIDASLATKLASLADRLA